LLEPWTWAVLLLAVGLGLTLTEVFVPSGGLLGFLAFSALVAAIVMAFRQGLGFGLAIVAGAVVGVPVVVGLALQYWPRTPLGRRMLLKSPEPQDALPDSPWQRYLKGLVGRVGETQTKMLPSGAITIDGRSVDAVSEGMALEAGQRVRVVEVRANRVVVRPMAEEDVRADNDDPLARPIDSIIPDPFGDRPA